ncbi:MAG: hypothetical protein ACREDG_02530, partial [Methylocella sp.]
MMIVQSEIATAVYMAEQVGEFLGDDTFPKLVKAVEGDEKWKEKLAHLKATGEHVSLADDIAAHGGLGIADFIMSALRGAFYNAADALGIEVPVGDFSDEAVAVRAAERGIKTRTKDLKEKLKGTGIPDDFVHKTRGASEDEVRRLIGEEAERDLTPGETNAILQAVKDLNAQRQKLTDARDRQYRDKTLPKLLKDTNDALAKAAKGSPEEKLLTLQKRHLEAQEKRYRLKAEHDGLPKGPIKDKKAAEFALAQLEEEKARVALELEKTRREIAIEKR